MSNEQSSILGQLLNTAIDLTLNYQMESSSNARVGLLPLTVKSTLKSNNSIPTWIFDFYSNEQLILSVELPHLLLTENGVTSTDSCGPKGPKSLELG